MTQTPVAVATTTNRPRLAIAEKQIDTLTAQRDTLAAALAALLRLDEAPTTGPEYAEAVEQAHAALATVTPTTGGAA